MKKLLYQPLVSFLEKREKSIESDIKHASDSKTQSDTLLGEQKEALKSALLEARDIREKAEEASKKEYESVIKQAKIDSKRIIDNAKKEIDVSTHHAKKDLMTHVGRLSLKISEKLIHKNLDAQTQESLIQTYLEEEHSENNDAKASVVETS